MIRPDVQTIIDEIKGLAAGSIDEQIYACKEIKKLFPSGKLKRGIDTSVIPELLPTIVKLMDSEHSVLQLEGSYLIDAIVRTKDEKEHIKLVIENGSIGRLIKLLSSSIPDVLIAALQALGHIAYKSPEEFIRIDCLSSALPHLSSTNKDISQHAVYLIRNLSYCPEMIPAILQSDGVENLSKLIESSNYNTSRYAVGTLFNLISINAEICQRVLDHGVLSTVKNLFDRIFLSDTKGASKDDKLAILEFIKNVASYGEGQTIMVIDEGFVPIILQNLKSIKSIDVKIESIKIIRNVILAKFDPDLFSTLYKNIGCKNADLLIAVLSAVKEIIETCPDKELCRQKIQDCGNSDKLQKLVDHSNEEIQRLAQFILDFINKEMLITRLPFFDVTADILELSELTSLNGRNGEVRSIFTFQIQPEHIPLITYGSDQATPRYEVQLRMFLCNNDTDPADDFPLECDIIIDDTEPILLPPYAPKPNSDAEQKRYSRPIDITQSIQSSRININRPHKLGIRLYNDLRPRAVGIWLVHRQNSNILMDRLLSTGIRRSVDETKNKIAEMMNPDDSNVAIDQLKISLLCPLMKTRLTIPARTKTCAHLQCFDLFNYLNMNEKRSSWKCPICNGNANYDNLVIDEYFMDLLRAVERTVEEVEIERDGNWKILEESYIEVSDDEDAAVLKEVVEVITLDDSNEDI